MRNKNKRFPCGIFTTTNSRFCSNASKRNRRRLFLLFVCSQLKSRRINCKTNRENISLQDFDQLSNKRSVKSNLNKMFHWLFDWKRVDWSSERRINFAEFEDTCRSVWFESNVLSKNPKDRKLELDTSMRDRSIHWQSCSRFSFLNRLVVRNEQ